MDYGCDEYWEERRARLMRARRRAAWRELGVAMLYAILAIAVVAAVAMTVREVALRSRNERAAYLRGRWGLDEADALVMAAADAAAAAGRLQAAGEGEEEAR